MTMQLKWPFFVVLPASCITPVLFALAIGAPTLRLSGVYLAIATIGLGEVLRAVYLNTDDLLGTEFFGGPMGLSGIPQRADVALIYGVLLGAIIVLWLVGRSGIGRAMAAMEQDELAARVLGVRVGRVKMAALVASAVLAGLAGSLGAHVSSFIGPNEYGFQPAVAIWSYALLGGIGTPLGPVVGAAVLTLLPELLRGAADLKGVFNGAIIVLVVLFLPRGLLPFRLRRRAA